MRGIRRSQRIGRRQEAGVGEAVGGLGLERSLSLSHIALPSGWPGKGGKL